MATNYKNTIYYAQTTNNSVPAASAGTGTVTSSETLLTGTGTSFLTELEVGDFIFNLTAGECRKITQVESATIARIDYAFGTNLSGANLRYVKKQNLHNSEVSVNVMTGATVTIDGESVAVGEKVIFSKSNRERGANQDFLDPICVNVSAGTAKIQIVK